MRRLWVALTTLVAIALLIGGIFLVLGAQERYDDAESIRSRATDDRARRAQLTAQADELATVIERNRRMTRRSVRAHERIVGLAAAAERKINAVIGASEALGNTQNELTQIQNQVVEARNDDDVERAESLLRNEARNGETKLARALEAERAAEQEAIEAGEAFEQGAR